jgi:hypothetical protein
MTNNDLAAFDVSEESNTSKMASARIVCSTCIATEPGNDSLVTTSLSSLLRRDDNYHHRNDRFTHVTKALPSTIRLRYLATFFDSAHYSIGIPFGD